MHYLIRKVLLGIILFFYSVIVAYDNTHQATASLVESQSSEEENKSGFIYSSRVAQADHGGSVRPMTPAEEKIYLQQQVAKAYAFEKHYGVSISKFEELMSNEWSVIVYKLMQTDLDDEKIWNLWKAYKKKRVWDFGWKDETESVLAKALKRRKDLQKKQKQVSEQARERSKKEQYQKFIEQQHQAVEDLYWVDDYALDESISDEVVQAREDALEQTKLEGYLQYDQSYELDDITCGYLLHQHIAYVEYLHCHGTALQQQYHKEICDIVTQAAHQNLKITKQLQHQYQAPMLEHATNFAQAAQQTNQKDWMSVTGVLSSIGMICVDICKDLYRRPLDYLQAVGEGVAESAYDLGHMLLRPDKALYGLGQMVYFVLETGAMAEAALEFPEHAEAKLRERYDHIGTALSALQQEFIDADAPARVKALTKFGADFYLPTKLTHAAGYLMGGLSSRARNMRNLEGVASLVDETLVTAETAEKIREVEIATEQGFTEKITTQFMEAESSIAKSSVIQPRPLNVLVDEVRKLGGVIPLHSKELVGEVKSRLKIIEKELRNFKLQKLNKLRQLYGQRKINGKLVKLSFDHICSIELSLIESRKNGGYVLKIGGGHHSGVYEALEKIGLVKIIKKEQLVTGVTDYILQNCLTGEMLPKSKTVFPLGWSEEKIVKSVWGIYENPLLKVEKSGCGKFYKIGTIENIDIQILWSEKGKNSQVIDFIHTMYPINK